MIVIDKAKEADRGAVISMMKDFYSSDAVMYPVPQENFVKTFDECLKSDVYAELFTAKYDGKTAGYMLTARTFSNEAGGMVTWIEELYVCPDMRGKMIGHAMLERILKDKSVRFRLEIEEENTGAVRLYKSFGFEMFGYGQMILEDKC